MKLLTQPILVMDTSTELMSVALQHGEQVLRWDGPGGAQSSAHLIPAIQGLMAQAGLAFADLGCIAFGQGPGSFTGLRTACSVAQGLGFAAGVPLVPVDTLMTVAEAARAAHAPGAQRWRVWALLDARMDEVYACAFDHDPLGGWQASSEALLIRPEALAAPMHEAGPVDALCGNAFAAYGERLPLPNLPRLPALPTAQAMLALVPELLKRGLAVPPEQAMPRYVRNKVAQTTAEREAHKRATQTA